MLDSSQTTTHYQPILLQKVQYEITDFFLHSGLFRENCQRNFQYCGWYLFHTGFLPVANKKATSGGPAMLALPVNLSTLL